MRPPFLCGFSIFKYVVLFSRIVMYLSLDRSLINGANESWIQY